MLGFFAARQLGALLRALRRRDLETAEQVLGAVSRTWCWDAAPGWAQRLERHQAMERLAQDATCLRQLAEGLQVPFGVASPVGRPPGRRPLGRCRRCRWTLWPERRQGTVDFLR